MSISSFPLLSIHSVRLTFSWNSSERARIFRNMEHQEQHCSSSLTPHPVPCDDMDDCDHPRVCYVCGVRHEQWGVHVYPFQIDLREWPSEKVCEWCYDRQEGLRAKIKPLIEVYGGEMGGEIDLADDRSIVN